MQDPTIAAEDLETWAGFLLDHSLGGIEPSDRVMIKGERACWPLMAVLERRVIEAGAIPDVYLIPPNNDRGRVWSATMGRSGQAAQLDTVPEWHRLRYESMTKYVEVLGAEDPSRYSELSGEEVRRLASADRPFANLRMARPWVLTLFPTPGFALVEGIPLDEYARFLVRASTTDPRPLRAAEERVAERLRGARRVIIRTASPQGRHLELGLDIREGRPMLSYGLRNFPDGEVFTSPDARSAEGEIYLDLPVHYGGQDIQGIYLKLAGGVITDYRAEVGQERLAAIIETDAGSHRLGEVAFGMNPGLERVLKHPLFVEKVGGTLHIAIGASYEDCFEEDPQSEDGRRRVRRLESDGVLNRSAQHVDIVADFRPGGCGRQVLVDDVELLSQGGIWVPG